MSGGKEGAQRVRDALDASIKTIGDTLLPLFDEKNYGILLSNLRVLKMMFFQLRLMFLFHLLLMPRNL